MSSLSWCILCIAAILSCSISLASLHMSFKIEVTVPSFLFFPLGELAFCDVALGAAGVVVSESFDSEDTAGTSADSVAAG